MKIVIRAGGIGTRLWPVSRISHPKQFQVIEGDKTMVANTYDRITPLLQDAGDVVFSVNENQYDVFTAALPSIDSSRIISEPATRNTGPAMCLEVCFLSELFDDDPVIASIPSDDHIGDPEAFRELLLHAESFLEHNPDYIVTPAVKPAYPDTGYSYFKMGEPVQSDGEERVYAIADVVEKPNHEHLRELLQTGVYYAHVGMYIWKLSTIKRLFETVQPKMYEICSEVAKLIIDDPHSKQAKQLYESIEKMTIESAITDKAPKLAMSVSDRIEWSDMGKWHVIKHILEKDHDDVVSKGDIDISKSTNSIVYSKDGNKKIVLHDVHNLAIIETEDALFISSLDRSAETKDILESLKKEGREDLL